MAHARAHSRQSSSASSLVPHLPRLVATCDRLTCWRCAAATGPLHRSDVSPAAGVQCDYALGSISGRRWFLRARLGVDVVAPSASLSGTDSAVPLVIANPGVKILATRFALTSDGGHHGRRLVVAQGCATARCCATGQRRSPFPIFVLTLYQRPWISHGQAGGPAHSRACVTPFTISRLRRRSQQRRHGLTPCRQGSCVGLATRIVRTTLADAARAPSGTAYRQKCGGSSSVPVGARLLLALPRTASGVDVRDAARPGVEHARRRAVSHPDAPALGIGHRGLAGDAAIGPSASSSLAVWDSLAPTAEAASLKLTKSGRHRVGRRRRIVERGSRRTTVRPTAVKFLLHRIAETRRGQSCTVKPSVARGQ